MIEGHGYFAAPGRHPGVDRRAGRDEGRGHRPAPAPVGGPRVAYAGRRRAEHLEPHGVQGAVAGRGRHRKRVRRVGGARSRDRHVREGEGTIRRARELDAAGGGRIDEAHAIARAEGAGALLGNEVPRWADAAGLVVDGRRDGGERVEEAIKGRHRLGDHEADGDLMGRVVDVPPAGGRHPLAILDHNARHRIGEPARSAVGGPRHGGAPEPQVGHVEGARHRVDGEVRIPATGQVRAESRRRQRPGRAAIVRAEHEARRAGEVREQTGGGVHVDRPVGSDVDAGLARIEAADNHRGAEAAGPACRRGDREAQGEREEQPARLHERCA